MKYYFSTGSCSLSPRIALHEAGYAHDGEAVDLAAKKIKSNGGDYLAVNPKGYVPALVLDDGTLLTENAVMLQYLADNKPEKKLAPPANGSMERYRFNEMLNFIGTEMHKGFSPLFNPKINEEMREAVIARFKLRCAWLAKQIDGKQYLFGDQFTVADGYLFTILNWARSRSVDVGPVLSAYFDRVKARPGVQAALQAEGIAL
jgi:glutathione S-transferase